MKRWSKLKKRIEGLLVPGAEVHLFKYRMDSQRGSTDLFSLIIKLDKKTLFEYPKNFKDKLGYYPYEVPDFTGMMHKYIETNVQQISKLEDKFGLYKLLASLDRRFK